MDFISKIGLSIILFILSWVIYYIIYEMLKLFGIKNDYLCETCFWWFISLILFVLIIP